MKQLIIVVKPFVAEAVLQALQEVDASACIIQEAKGYSRQKGYLDRYVGGEYSKVYLPKVEISVWVADDKLAEAEEKIIKAARTGRIGDGKVLVVDLALPDPLDF